MIGFDPTALDQWSEDREFKVEAGRTTAYAAATNDTNPKHTAGELAPPLFAVVPVWEAIGLAVARVTPPEVLMRVVHGGQDIRFHRAIVPGDLLRSRAAPIGIGVRGSGTTVVVSTESRDEAGELVNEQYYTLFFRGVSDGEGGGRTAPEHKLTAEVKARPPIAEAIHPVDADQTFRYADASGDRMPIHLDDSLARAMGLPGIIVHGLCTMAFAGRAVVEEVAGGDSARLRRLAVRFSRPLLPGQTITTRIFDAGPLPGPPGNGDPVHAYAFESVNPEGQAAVKDGWAEVAG
jgi:acyl dehydratase